ncbi:baculoviral IAP repeat-containing protein 5 [Glossina fuscipes]|uniref:Baculoviral IAP repeat-containing protein 5 n=2 Tax=Nemorhina TaxID=44051 RepID=A0A9C6DX86_9MUSC|nr:baculoviral IAP repeat-containing protein 5 [Glossina fuscipes]KAI9578333.1 hypothetical protein GQX74_014204 [Glossina fuscipes]
MYENIDLSAKFDNFKNVYLMEKHRIDSYKKWPFNDNFPCSVVKMAEAGFFWSGNDKENDTATCFVCQKTLHGWESTDNPWKEHAKHAPQCQFVKYGRKEKDLLLEEFLVIFGIIYKSKMQREINRIREVFKAEVSDELENFRTQK